MVKKTNQGLNVTSLKGKKSCHTGARRNAGWNIPIGYMLRMKLIPAVQCDNKLNDFLSAADFFSESCVSGNGFVLHSISFFKLILFNFVSGKLALKSQKLQTSSACLIHVNTLHYDV